MKDEYDYMSYRRDLPGFGEPAEGAWDGWMSLNSDTRTGGIIGVFRQGAKEKSRMVFVKHLEPGQIYHVRLAPGGEDILKAPGKTIMEEGFRVEITELYEERIYEIGIDW